VASETGVGLVRLCLAWILCSPNGRVVLDGGRLGDADAHFYGIWDVLSLKSGASSLVHGLTPRLVDKIMKRVDIQSELWFFQRIFQKKESAEERRNEMNETEEKDNVLMVDDDDPTLRTGHERVRVQ
jgi:hypothetical protein